eukprot:Rmarinus@m.27821
MATNTPPSALSLESIVPNTLNEEISVTLMRDVIRVGRRLRLVLLPSYGDIKAELRDWDLWGPLLICLVLAVQLSIVAPDDEASLIFSSTFIVMWVGAAAITLNARLLGGALSFWQSVCFLGYCVFPFCVAAFFCGIVNLAVCNDSVVAWVFRVIFAATAWGWSTVASVGFVSEVVGDDKRLLVVYPVFLFYLALSWMVVLTYSAGDDC